MHLTRAGDKAPQSGIRVRLDDRIAFSDTTGVALFEYLPAPAKILVVDCPRFERVEMEAGAGGKTEIALVPLKRCDVVLECVLEDGEAVPGARVTLTRSGNAYAVLPLEGVSGFDGKLPFAELPGGEWTVDVVAPGCDRLKTSLVLAEAKGIAKLALKPSAASVKIEGSCAPGATIDAVRASQGEEGLKPVATATCDGAGRFAIEVPARTRGAATSPHRALLRARKEGHLDTFFAVEYADLRGPVTIPLAAAPGTIDEKEPNADAQTATAAPKAGTVRFAISEKGDRDVFALELTEDGLLTIRIAKCPLSMTALLFDARGIEKGRVNQYGGQPLEWGLPLPSGRWHLGFEAWGGQETRADRIEAVLTLDAAADAHERNEEAATGAAIVPGIETWGAIFPAKDRDAYRVRVDAAGLLRVQFAPRPIALTCTILDGRGQICALANNYGNQPLDLTGHLPKAGAYTILVSHWGDSESSIVPYRMRTDFAPAGIEEIAADLALPLDTTVSGSINPVKDRDAWKIDIRESGTLRVRVAPRVLGVTLSVLGADRKPLGSANAYGNQACELVVSLQRPGFHFVEVMHWGDADDSALPYILSNEFHPNDSWDARRNETGASSSRISLARTVTGAIATVGDRDVYRFQVPRKSILTADLPGYALGTTLRLTGPSKKEFGLTNNYGHQPNRLVAQVVEPGTHTMGVECWGNADWTPDRYRLRIRLDPEDPLEPNNAYAEATPLAISRGLSGTILPVGDVDAYRVDLPEKGMFRLFVTANPLGRTARVIDGAGKEVLLANNYGNQPIDMKWDNPAPQRVWVKIENWGNSEASPVPYTVSVTREKDPLPPRAKLTVSPGGKPRTAAFTLAATEGEAASFQADLNGDGIFDASTATFSKTWDRGGHYAVMARVAGSSGDGWTFAWVDARDPAEEPDIEVEFLRPAPGEILLADTTVEFDAWGRDGSAVSGATLYLGEEILGQFDRPPYIATLPVSKIAGKASKLRILAWSERGWKAAAELEVSAPPLVNLRPEPGASVTSGGAVVEWDTAEEGPSEVVVGGKTFTGSAGRHHAVVVSGLEAGAAHTWTARTGTLASEPRVLNCIRGIEFAERRYEAKIERDYDQKGVVRVVNHGAAKASLVLRVASEQKDLLVGFVGEGSQDTKVSLEPGEYRDVALGLSAQDAMQEKYVFHVTLEGSFGAGMHSDSVEFEVAVRMPKVSYEVKVSEPDPGTLARRVEIVNTGDTITDFGASLDESSGAVLTPAVRHARLEAGRTLTLLVSPHLTPDWKDFDAKLSLRGVHMKKETALSFKLPAGKRIVRAVVGSRQDNTANDWICTNRPDATTGLSVPAGPTTGSPVDLTAPPPPPLKPPEPPKPGSPEKICADIIAMLEKAMKEGGYVPEWNLDDFWSALNYTEAVSSTFNPARRHVGNLHLGKHLDTEDGGTDFNGNAFKPVRTGHEVELYKELKKFVRNGWIGPDGKPRPLDHAQVLEMALRVSKTQKGTSNVPLAILTSHNVIRILARAQQWDGPGMTGDYGHNQFDPMWPVLQDLRGVQSVDDGPTLGNELVGLGKTRALMAGKPGSYALDLFDAKSEKPLFVGLPGSDESSSLNGGSHYYLWIGMLGRGVLGRVATILGVVKEQIVKWQMGDGERGGKEGGYANKGQDVVTCVTEALERMQKEKQK
ncbi:MAG: hypothetical protein AAB074_06585 [Planctomycetota bacterium]